MVPTSHPMNAFPGGDHLFKETSCEFLFLLGKRLAHFYFQWQPTPWTTLLVWAVSTILMFFSLLWCVNLFYRFLCRIFWLIFCQSRMPSPPRRDEEFYHRFHQDLTTVSHSPSQFKGEEMAQGHIVPFSPWVISMAVWLDPGTTANTQWVAS